MVASDSTTTSTAKRNGNTSNSESKKKTTQTLRWRAVMQLEELTAKMRLQRNLPHVSSTKQKEGQDDTMAMEKKYQALQKEASRAAAILGFIVAQQQQQQQQQNSAHNNTVPSSQNDDDDTYFKEAAKSALTSWEARVMCGGRGGEDGDDGECEPVSPTQKAMGGVLTQTAGRVASSAPPQSALKKSHEASSSGPAVHTLQKRVVFNIHRKTAPTPLMNSVISTEKENVTPATVSKDKEAARGANSTKGSKPTMTASTSNVSTKPLNSVEEVDEVGDRLEQEMLGDIETLVAQVKAKHISASNALSQESRTLDATNDKMRRNVDKTKDQAKKLDQYAGGGRGGGSDGGLARFVPAPIMMVMRPLWAMIMQVLYILLILAAAGSTFMLIFLVPKRF